MSEDDPRFPAMAAEARRKPDPEKPEFPHAGCDGIIWATETCCRGTPEPKAILGSSNERKMPPFARLSDLQGCLASAAGPVHGVFVTAVVTGKRLESVLGDPCACVGSPDAVIREPRTMASGKRLAARLEDAMEKGGAVTTAFPTVLIRGRSPAATFDAPQPGPTWLRQVADSAAPFVRA